VKGAVASRAIHQSVIQTAWPAQQRGEANEIGTEILFSIGLRILEFKPATGDQSIREQLFSAIADFWEFRILDQDPRRLQLVEFLVAVAKIFAEDISVVFSYYRENRLKLNLGFGEQVRHLGQRDLAVTGHVEIL
jgi:hypothetical protein